MIVRHDSPQTVGKLFDNYYGTSREVREGPYSPASPLNMEQDEERDKPLTIPETPTTPNASTAPPKETKKKKNISHQIPLRKPKETSLTTHQEKTITYQVPEEYPQKAWSGEYPGCRGMPPKKLIKDS